MSWFSDIFSSGVSGVIDSVGNAIDKLSTSDEEKLQLKNELQVELDSFKATQLTHVENMEKEVSSRHKADMVSDSWLSKNVRPLSLIFLTVSTVVLAYATIFSDLTEGQVNSLEGWIPLLQSLLLGCYGFYYGGRSLEKVKNVAAKKANSQEK